MSFPGEIWSYIILYHLDSTASQLIIIIIITTIPRHLVQLWAKIPLYIYICIYLYVYLYLSSVYHYIQCCSLGLFVTHFCYLRKNLTKVNSFVNHYKPKRQRLLYPILQMRSDRSSNFLLVNQLVSGRAGIQIQTVCIWVMKV